MSDQKKRLITAQELAGQLGVALRTVHEWTEQKKIPYVQFTQRTIRYDLEEIIARKTVTPKSLLAV